ncbi:MAG: hypothetical protein J5928_02590 [Firmicutes bacterium]|nr:hypothetical protein [Bacillota bacterium]
MANLFSQFIYIVIGALFIAALGLIWAFGASHNAKNRDPEMQEKQDRACDSCALASMCSRFGKEDGNCSDFSGTNE